MKKQENRQKINEDLNRQFYDEAFAEVFSNLKIIKSLLEDFINEDWVKLIDFNSMKVTKSVFKSITRRRRESDLLIQFNLKNSSKLNVFILMEFQRKPEDMILRLLEYLLRCYQKQKKVGEKLSPVIPIVIYNGKPVWRENPEMENQFHTMSETLRPYLPLYRYILIDIVRMDDLWLTELKDSAAYFFQLEKTDLKSIAHAEERIINLLKELRKGETEIFNLLVSYISGLMSYKGVDSKAVNYYIEHVEERGEGMLAESFDELMESKYEEGQKKERIDMVLKMLEAGLDIKMISHISGMLSNDIVKLKSKNKEDQ